MVRCIVLLPVLLVLGCGLSEYEAHMLESQRRAERFDEENRLLGSGLEVPTKEVRPPGATLPEVKIAVKLVNLSMRLPKGINPTFEPNLWRGKFYEYARLKEKAPAPPAIQPGQPGQPQPGQPQPGQPPAAQQPNPAVGGNTSGTDGITAVLLAWDDKEMEHDKFVKDVLRWFPPNPAKPPPTGTVFNATPARRPPFTTEVYDILDSQENLDRVVFRNKGKVNLAIIFKVQKDKIQQVSRALQLSLESMILEDSTP
jgi:hypothetical protein